MSLETLRLTLLPCSPEHLLALVDHPERLETLLGLRGADDLRPFYVSDEVSPDWLAALRDSHGPDVWRHGFFVVDRESGWAHTLPLSNPSTRVLQKCGFRHIGAVVDPEDGPVWRWERGPDPME